MAQNAPTAPRNPSLTPAIIEGLARLAGITDSADDKSVAAACRWVETVVQNERVRVALNGTEGRYQIWIASDDGSEQIAAAADDVQTLGKTYKRLHSLQANVSRITDNGREIDIIRGKGRDRYEVTRDIFGDD